MIKIIKKDWIQTVSNNKLFFKQSITKVYLTNKENKRISSIKLQIPDSEVQK